MSDSLQKKILFPSFFFSWMFYYFYFFAVMYEKNNVFSLNSRLCFAFILATRLLYFGLHKHAANHWPIFFHISFQFRNLPPHFRGTTWIGKWHLFSFYYFFFICAWYVEIWVRAHNTQIYSAQEKQIGTTRTPLLQQ